MSQIMNTKRRISDIYQETETASEEPSQKLQKMEDLTPYIFSQPSCIIKSIFLMCYDDPYPTKPKNGKQYRQKTIGKKATLVTLRSVCKSFLFIVDNCGKWNPEYTIASLSIIMSGRKRLGWPNIPNMSICPVSSEGKEILSKQMFPDMKPQQNSSDDVDIKKMTISGSKIFDNMGRLPASLVELSLFGPCKLTAFGYITGLKSLTIMDMNSYSLNSVADENLKWFPSSLESLTISGEGMMSEFLAESDLKNLKYLDISEAGFTGKTSGFDTNYESNMTTAISKMVSLKSLEICLGKDYSPDNQRSFYECLNVLTPEVTHLSIYNTGIDEDFFKTHTKIVQLSVSADKAKANKFDAIQSSLNSISTAAGFRHISGSLTSLTMRCYTITDNVIHAIRNLTRLLELDLSWCNSVAVYRFLAELPKTIQTLDLTGIKSRLIGERDQQIHSECSDLIGNEAWRAISSLPKLIDLDLSYTTIHNKDACYLLQMSQITRLSLKGCANITPDILTMIPISNVKTRRVLLGYNDLFRNMFDWMFSVSPINYEALEICITRGGVTYADEYFMSLIEACLGASKITTVSMLPYVGLFLQFYGDDLEDISSVFSVMLNAVEKLDLKESVYALIEEMMEYHCIYTFLKDPDNADVVSKLMGQYM